VSRVAQPAEKVLAIGSVMRALVDELGLDPEPIVIAITAREVSKKDMPLQLKADGPPEVTWRIPPVVMAALIDAATRVAMGTDTRDLGILGAPGVHDEDPGWIPGHGEEGD
jgi:hypothetical protein